ncbi:MAG: DUF6249 domain-containing protein [Prevotellaceae bacterium]|jgi:purine-cytosine permease-like protein|nr:DUF6249 domain-containing protein [Prevotellaceae bacterium]
MDDVTGILAIIGIFIAPMVAIVVVAYFFARSIRRRNELRAELYSKALEKGVELPPNLFAREAKPKSPQHAFNVGVICAGLGLGVALAFAIMGGVACRREFFYVAALGAIPTLIGAAYFAIYAVGKKQQHGQA